MAKETTSTRRAQGDLEVHGARDGLALDRAQLEMVQVRLIMHSLINARLSGICHDAAKTTRIRESSYPVYWVEAFNSALQKWMPVDPLVTKTIAKPSKFEPPASEPENGMSYVVVFEEDGVARDVTKRYTKAYNAKTRKSRVEVSKGGEEWWRKTLGRYRRGHDLVRTLPLPLPLPARLMHPSWLQDRDQVEDSELVAKEAQEPMPRNIQDFKNHPHYALERHLRRHEVIHPKLEIGKVAAGKSSTGGGKVLEPIYRRRDVKLLKSADRWYRLGRDVKVG